MDPNKTMTDKDKAYLKEIQKLWDLLEESSVPYRKAPWLVENMKKVAATNSNHSIIRKDESSQLRTYGFVDPKVFNSYFYGCQDHYLISSRRGFYYWPCANDGITGVCPKKDPSYTNGSPRPCGTCKYRKGLTLTPVDLQRHFQTTRWPDQGLIKITPLQPDGNTHFLLWQLGYPNWESVNTQDKVNEIAKLINSQEAGFHMEEKLKNSADALCRAIRASGLDYLKASGAYPGSLQIWLFFQQPLSVQKAIDLGKVLVLKAILEEGLTDMSFFDMMVPSRPPKEKGASGSSVELPLQGCSLVHGRTYFLDENDENVRYEHSLRFLQNIRKIPANSVEDLLHKNKKRFFEWMDPKTKTNVPKPQSQVLQLFDDPNDTTKFLASDVEGTVSITLKNGVRVQKNNLKPRLIGQLLLLGSYWNPEETKSNGRFFTGSRVVQHAHIEGDAIHLPRGLYSELLRRLDEAMIPYEMKDETVQGRPLEMNFLATLRPEQEVMVSSLMKEPHGILAAATGAGKTVMAAALIAKAQVSTLVLVNNLRILDSWVDTLNAYLQFENPAFEANLPDAKRFPGKIGVLQGNNNSLCQRVDIAMIPSLFTKKNLPELIEPYGMVIFDECHHAASARNIELLDRIAAKRVYGLTATPQRPDGLSPTLFWEFGPILGEYSSKEQMKAQTFNRYFIVRNSEFVPISQKATDFVRISQEASYDPARNLQIVEDVLDAIDQGRTVLVLSRYVLHARHLARMIEKADPTLEILVNTGDEEDKETIGERYKELRDKDRVVLVGTYNGMGEGFDFPRLDTLMCTMPVDSSIVVSQAIGRIHRQVKAKKDVYVYDYVDRNVSMFQRMFASRQREYFTQGYQMNVISQNPSIQDKLPYSVERYALQPQIDDSGIIRDYRTVLIEDIRQAKRQISVVLDDLDERARDELLELLKPAFERKLRIDLFIEKAGRETIDVLEKNGVIVHIHQRIIGRFIVIDRHLSWFGPLGMDVLAIQEGQWQRVDDKLVADCFMDARREEERLMLNRQNGRDKNHTA